MASQDGLRRLAQHRNGTQLTCPVPKKKCFLLVKKNYLVLQSNISLLQKPISPVQKYALHVKNYFYFVTTISPCCKDCLLTGQEQACSRINRLAVQLVRWVSPCRKWPRIYTIMAAISYLPLITSICETLFQTR